MNCSSLSCCQCITYIQNSACKCCECELLWFSPASCFLDQTWIYHVRKALLTANESLVSVAMRYVSRFSFLLCVELSNCFLVFISTPVFYACWHDLLDCWKLFTPLPPRLASFFAVIYQHIELWFTPTIMTFSVSKVVPSWKRLRIIYSW